MLSLVLLVTALIAGCGNRDGATRRRPEPTPPAREPLRGAEVSVKGRVTATYGSHVFEVGSGPERVIVVLARPHVHVIGSDVEVTGRVRTFRRQEIEAELGVGLGPEVSPLEEASCLVATNLGGGDPGIEAPSDDGRTSSGSTPASLPRKDQ
ncbi:MAG: hypothetical protein M3179_07870 [Actinomycetota bacterium]|nr:hypothetical protein [Actinomycetota bacterium]